MEHSSEHELDLLRLMRLAWAATRRHMVVATLLPLLALSLAATYTAYQTPLYKAKASAFIEDQSRQLIKDVEVGYYLTRDVIQAQKVLAGTDRVLERAARLAVAGGKNKGETEQELLGWLGGSSVGVEGQLITFHAVHEDPDLAAVLANAWCKAFVQEMMERERAGKVYTRDFLSSEIPALRNAWIQKQDELLQFQMESSFDPKDFETHPVIRKHNELSQKLNDLETRRIELRNDLALWEQHQDKVETLLQMPLTQKDTQLSELEKALREQRLKLMQARLEYAAGSQLLVDLSNQVKLLEEQARESLEAMKRRLTLEMQRVEANIAEFSRAREANEKEYTALKSKEARYRVLSSEVERAKRQYDELAQEQGAADVVGRLKFASVQDWEPAVAPDAPFHPNWRKNLMLGFLLGVLLAGMLIFALEKMDTTVKSPLELKERLGVTVLGAFPQLHKREVVEEGYFLAKEQPDLAVLEQLKVVRNSLTISYAQSNGSGMVVLVTSAREGEGKSLVSNNLAILFAQSGWRTLLIDLDVRKSTLSRAWKVPRERGMQDLLQGAGLAQCVVPTVQPNLDILSSSGIRNASEVSEAAALERLLKDARASYATVVIDSPPILLVADAFHVVRHCDASLVVVRSRLTRKANVLQAVEVLHRAQARDMAFIVNGLGRLDVETSEYGYGYGYGYGYSYGRGYGYGYGHKSKEKEEERGA